MTQNSEVLAHKIMPIDAWYFKPNVKIPVNNLNSNTTKVMGHTLLLLRLIGKILESL